ncbi:MAG: hypothetical protein ICV54_30110 [Nostoc sp. C3-bin3]|nr:hypothetical protein [Nostoc sp. C3-bin3]
MWDREYSIGLQHLKSFNYLPQECQQMQVICDGAVSSTGSDRITRLRENGNLEDAPSAMLKYLGELKRSPLNRCSRGWSGS